MDEVRQRPRVSVNLARTLNMGNYQSLRVDVGMTDDVQSEETPDGAFHRIEKQVSTWLKQECLPVEKSIVTRKKEK